MSINTITFQGSVESLPTLQIEKNNDHIPQESTIGTATYATKTCDVSCRLLF